ncbi:unnamed protein product [Ilex paraguariensis]|uniref:Uncharacterized protein n=1 Tax=Ilex paraguariensis TaxID=185542 RepID=A0ABC8THP1_9AQUA
MDLEEVCLCDNTCVALELDLCACGSTFVLVVLKFCLDLQGIWIGMICGVVTQSLTLCFLTWRTDWNEQVAKAAERLSQWYLKSSEESNHNSNHV